MPINVKIAYCQVKYKGTKTRKVFKAFLLWHAEYCVVGHQIINEDNGNDPVWGKISQVQESIHHST